jgi:tetrapyrrole methylase family protein/MazG family protein
VAWSAHPEVVVIGLGPGGGDHVTTETLDLIAAIPHRYLRTSVHPTAHLVPDAVTFDHLYDSADVFAEVYERIADELVAAAHEHGRVLYAVPGSPLVLERSVRRLLADERIACDVRPAMSFLDVAWARLGIDPVEAGVRLVDGHEFATSAAGERGPLLVAHVHADWVLSEIKLTVDDLDGAGDDDEVVILQALGTPDERIDRTTWSELDRTVAADHLTSLYVPRLSAPVGVEYVRFHRLARTLREQCPWDVEQTHDSLVPYLLEETYEVVDALQALDPDDPSTDDALVEELGDLLYQIEFHATIAEQEGRFTIADVARGVHDKLVRRHPHVFGDVEATDSATVLGNWEAIKRTEKQRTSIFDGVPASMPALAAADAVQRKAAKVGFDWPDVDGALPKIAEEAAEVVAARDTDPGRLAAEVGDLLFSMVNVARHLGVDPELALRAATSTFRRRFDAVEQLAAARGMEVHDAGLAALDALWDEVKRSERAAPSEPAASEPAGPPTAAPWTSG